MTYKNPERVAWLVVYSAFFVFLVLCAAIPFGIRYYLHHATTSQPATLEVIDGTVRVREPGAAAPIAVAKTVQVPTIPVPEGTSIETDANSKSILTFLDGSTTTLFPSTQILVRTMRVSTFPWGVEPLSILLDQTRGYIRVGAAQQIPQGGDAARARTFQVYTPHLLATVAEGSYAIEVDGNTSQLVVRDGTATVTAQSRTVTVVNGQRTVAHRDEPPQPPMPAAQDLIVNGDFLDPRSRGWNDLIEFPNVPGVPAGQLSNPTLDNRVTLRIQRSGSNQTSAIAGVAQEIKRDVSDYRLMRLSADIRLQYQSLSGGGILSSEYPLILRLKYRDVYGSEAEWVHGFYCQNVTNNPTNNGEQVSQNVWDPFMSLNLLETLDPRPYYITSLQIYASGWDYDAYVTGIRLIVE